MWQISVDSSTCNAVKQFSLDVAIRAVCVSENMKKLLVGTQHCSILELPLDENVSQLATNNSKGDPHIVLVSGHFKDEVWGLAVRPPVPGYPRQRGENEVRIILTRN